MTLLPALVLLAFGVALLWGGGEALVRGAVSLARLARVSPAVVGLTIVAMGTSMPELAVSLLAGLGGRSDIAVGNVVGSNLFNTGVILGIAALIVPLSVHLSAVKLEWPFMFLTTCVLALLAQSGVVNRVAGALFLIALAGFTVAMIRIARTKAQPAEIQEMASELAGRTITISALADVGFVVLGIGLLVTGAHALVRGAVGLAQLAGWTERVIGLTIVSAGTSVPELATSLVAARHKHTDMAVANVLGSNIFNILGILGTVALVQPQTVNPQIATSDVWWMVGAAALIFPLMRSGMRISRGEGALLLGGYGVYLWFLLAR